MIRTLGRHLLGRTLLILLVAFLAATSLAADTICTPRCIHSAAANAATQLVQSEGVLVIAHRGDSRDYPENTLPAFVAAVRAGANLVELDYHHTADNVPVVMHDDTLDRTTDAPSRWAAHNIYVKNEPLERIRQLDAGSWKDARFRGIRVPTLDEALAVIQSGSTTLIERKAGDAATCVALLQQRGLVGSVVVQSFDWDFIAQCHRLEPRLVLGALGGYELTAEKLDQIAATGAQLVVWHHESLDEKAIRAIHDRGWKAWAFTVDDPQRVEHLIKIGLDGIITNVPAVMVQLVERLQRRVPPKSQTLACSAESRTPCGKTSACQWRSSLCCNSTVREKSGTRRCMSHIWRPSRQFKSSRHRCSR